MNVGGAAVEPSPPNLSTHSLSLIDDGRSWIGRFSLVIVVNWKEWLRRVRNRKGVFSHVARYRLRPGHLHATSKKILKWVDICETRLLTLNQRTVLIFYSCIQFIFTICWLRPYSYPKLSSITVKQIHKLVTRKNKNSSFVKIRFHSYWTKNRGKEVQTATTTHA